MNNLWDRILQSKQPLLKFKSESGVSACIYPTPYQGKSDVVRWFYSRNNGCQIFFACSQEISDKIEADTWAEVDREFTEFVEFQLMPYCVENTDWEKCSKYEFEYDETVPVDKRLKGEEHFEHGCGGSICHCEPFGEGDFTYGIANESEFILN